MGPPSALHADDAIDDLLEDPEVVARADKITEILQCCGLVGPPNVPNEGWEMPDRRHVMLFNVLDRASDLLGRKAAGCMEANLMSFKLDEAPIQGT